MSNKYLVKIHQWIDGVLQIVHHFFDSLFEAKEFTKELDNGRYKVYNKEGHLVDSGTASTDTYA
jgi:hypothetical protein